MASGPITPWEIDEETMETDFIFGGSKITTDGDCSHKIKSCLLLGRKAMTNLDSILKSRDITFPTKVHLVKAMVFSTNHIWMWELDYNKSWALKNWCFWTMVLEKTLDSTLDSKEIQPVHPKGNQSWIFIGRTEPKAETPNTLVTWCKELTHLKRPWCWESLKKGGKYVSITDTMDMNLSRLQELVMNRETWHSAVRGVTKNWHGWETELKWPCFNYVEALLEE